MKNFNRKIKLNPKPTNLFLKGVDIMITISKLSSNELYASKISEKSLVGYAKVRELLILFEMEGFIKFIKNGDSKFKKNICLTAKGGKIAESLCAIRKKGIF